MEQSLRNELNSCIRELYAIANALEDAAAEVKNSIQGMSTWSYTNTLYNCASSYRNAARKLEKIQ